MKCAVCLSPALFMSEIMISSQDITLRILIPLLGVEAEDFRQLGRTDGG